MINAEKKNLRDLLGESVQYKVPSNQRDFEWKKDQAEDFWEDISSDGGTFLGTVVLNISNEKEPTIVDGQQRFTTIFILLAACKNRAKEIGNRTLAEEIRRKLMFTDDTTGEIRDSKLIPSPSISDVFSKTIVSDEWDGKSFSIKENKKQANKIKVIYNYFSDKISNHDLNDIRKLLENLYGSALVVIKIDDDLEALEIFERMNARGMELNAADLLKNYFFSSDAIKDLEERWEVIVENSLGNIARMIKYFYVSKRGYVQKKDLYKALKKYAEEIGPKKMIEELEFFSRLHYLLGNSTYYSIIEWSDDNKIEYFAKEYNAQLLNGVFDALSLFGVTQTYPLVIKSLTELTLINDSNEREKLADKLSVFLQSLEKYHFINSAIAQRPGNEVEKYYADKCGERINNSEDLKVFFKTITDDLRSKRVAKEEFPKKFSEVDYKKDFTLIYYIYDRMNNHGRIGGQRVEIYNPDKKILKRNFNIDHLISQNMSAYDFNVSDLGEETLHNIGNLLVTSLHTNSELGNKHIKDTFDILSRKEKLPEVEKLIEEWKDKEWKTVNDARKNIEERGKKLGERAFNEVWNF